MKKERKKKPPKDNNNRKKHSSLNDILSIVYKDTYTQRESRERVYVKKKNKRGTREKEQQMVHLILGSIEEKVPTRA